MKRRLVEKLTPDLRKGGTAVAVSEIKVPTGKAQLWVRDTELTGFGVVVGKHARTFVVEYRSDGKKRCDVIGRHGVARDDGHLWNVTLARLRAKELLGQVAGGGDPGESRRAMLDGPTLRMALEFHVGKMKAGENRRGKVCSPRSIATIDNEVRKHFAGWLDRPIVEVTADVIDAVRKAVEKNAERIEGSNPKNPPGRAIANRLLAHVGAIWRSYHRRYGLPVTNPTERLIQGALKPRGTRIADDGFADWYSKVITIAPVRRDLQLVGLFTGVRSSGVKSLRWPDIDWERGLIHVTTTKGDRPYTLPMVATVRAVLERRRAENAVEFARYGGDGGFVFPSVTRDGKRVIAVAEPKERRTVDGGRVKFLPGVQASRVSFNSIAMEVGIPQEAREALVNHAGKGVNVRSYGFPQNWSYLAECARTIERALLEKMGRSSV